MAYVPNNSLNYFCTMCGNTSYFSSYAAVGTSMGPYCLYCTGQAPNLSTSAKSYFTYAPFSTKPPEPKELPRETTTTPLIGYRVWKLDRKEGKLGSTFMKQYFWPFRKPVCKDPIDDVGIHAVKSGRIIRDGSANNSSIWNPAGIGMFDEPTLPALWDSYKADVAGSVYLWGEIKEHSLGYTAEFAYPKELWMPEETDPLTVMQLEHNYGVPVTLRGDLKRHFTEEDGDRIALAIAKQMGNLAAQQVNQVITSSFSMPNGQITYFTYGGSAGSSLMPAPTPSNPPGAIQKYSKP